MKIVGAVIAGTLGFILLWTPPAFSSQLLSSYNLLQNVTVDRKGGELLIQLKFKNPPIHFQGPKFFKKSIQVDFPLAYVNPSKRYFETGDDRVRQVYVSQFDPKRLRLRLMLASGVSIPKDQTVVEQVGRVLRIRINSATSEPSSTKSEASDPLLFLRHQQLEKEVKKESQSLSPKQRTVFQLKIFQEMSIPEIASILNLAEGTVKTHLFRATQFIQRRLQGWMDN